MTKTSPLLSRERAAHPLHAYNVPVCEERIGERVVQWLTRQSEDLGLDSQLRAKLPFFLTTSKNLRTISLKRLEGVWTLSLCLKLYAQRHSFNFLAIYFEKT